MRRCKNCWWREVALTGEKKWKCNINPIKRYNNPDIHGLLCKMHIYEKDALEQIEKNKESIV